MLLVQLLNYLQTTTSIICIQRKHTIHCFPKQFSSFYFLNVFLTLSTIYVDALSSSFLRYRSFCQKYISRTLQSLSNFEILLRCSTSSSAEAPDFVYNLRRYSLIKINPGFKVFLLVRFGL